MASTNVYHCISSVLSSDATPARVKNGASRASFRKMTSQLLVMMSRSCWCHQKHAPFEHEKWQKRWLCRAHCFVISPIRVNRRQSNLCPKILHTSPEEKIVQSKKNECHTSTSITKHTHGGHDGVTCSRLGHPRHILTRGAWRCKYHHLFVCVKCLQLH